MLYFVSAISMLVVAIILSMGIWNMARGGTASRSQKFMRYRIIAQFAAVVVVMITLYFTTR